MMGTPSNERPDCFWRSDLLAAAHALERIVREGLFVRYSAATTGVT
jgi:hypothetical protein